MIPRRFFWLFDFIILAFAFLASYAFFPVIRNLFFSEHLLSTHWFDFLSLSLSGQALPGVFELFWVFLAIMPVTLVGLDLLGCNRSLLHQTRTSIFVGSMIATLAGLSFVILILFALKRYEWSRLFIFSFSFFTGICLCGYRIILRTFTIQNNRTGHYAKNVVLIGSTPALEWMARYIDKHISKAEFHIWGYLRITPDQAPPRITVATNVPANMPVSLMPLLADVTDLGKILVNNPIHEVFAIQPVDNGDWLRQVAEECHYFQVTLRIIPEALLMASWRNMWLFYRQYSHNLPAIILEPMVWNTDALFLKRLMDIFISVIALIILAPVFAIIAISIKISTPQLPIFYPWRVVGKNGVEFTGYKFTTMWADADQRKYEMMSQNEMKGPVFKIKQDPRITPLGKILRKFSLNELPQFWSVLKGDMSLVGPRPAFREELERYELWHKRKLSVQPGISCLWQISGRNKISDFDEWARLDLEYIENWSLWLDVKILLKTFWVVVSGSGS
jgi:exopolysaccharide biosynthesis polyprenyl glycosylphosphotransferase